MGKASIIERATAYAPDEFIPLAEAVRVAFPAGGVKVSSLRLEASRGRLTVYRIAGKVMTTLADVRRMADLCRVEPSLPASGSGPHPATETQSGSTSTADASVALAAARLTLDRLRRDPSSASTAAAAPKRRGRS